MGNLISFDHYYSSGKTLIRADRAKSIQNVKTKQKLNSVLRGIKNYASQGSTSMPIYRDEDINGVRLELKRLGYEFNTYGDRVEWYTTDVDMYSTKGSGEYNAAKACVDARAERFSSAIQKCNSRISEGVYSCDFSDPFLESKVGDFVHQLDEAGYKNVRTEGGNITFDL